MTKLTKSALWTAGWLLSVFAAFGSGRWVAGYHVPSEMTSIFQQELINAIDVEHDLESLDAGKQSELRESLNLRLDNHIMLLSSFKDYVSSDKDRESAKKFLRRVGEHRKNYPVIYREVPKTVPGAAEANAELGKANNYVDEILRPYTDEKK